VLVSNLPNKFFLEEVFTLQFQVQNRSDTPIRPQLVATLGGKAGVQVFGNCSGVVPEVVPGGLSAPVSLSFLPVRSGIQPLPRIVLHDLRTGAQYDWGVYTSTTGIPIPLAIFVEKHDKKIDGNLKLSDHSDGSETLTSYMHKESVSDVLEENRRTENVATEEIVKVDEKQEESRGESSERTEGEEVAPLEVQVEATSTRDRTDIVEQNIPVAMATPTVENIDLMEVGEAKAEESFASAPSESTAVNTEQPAGTEPNTF